MISKINSTILTLLISGFHCMSSGSDSLQSELEKREIYIHQQKQVLKLYDLALKDCDSTNALLMRQGGSMNSENKLLKIQLSNKEAAIKNQNVIVKVMAGVILTLVAGEVIQEAVRKN